MARTEDSIRQVRGNVGRNTVRTLAFQLATLGLGLVTNVVVARTIGPEGKGLLSFLSYALYVGITLGGLGLQPAAIQMIGKERFPAGVVAASQILMSLAAGALGAVLCAVVLPGFRERMGLETGVILAFLPVLVLALLQLNLSGVLIGLGRIGTVNALQLIGPALWAIGSLVVLVLLHGNRTQGAYAWLGAQVVGPLVLLGWILVRARPQLRGAGACIRASVRFGREAFLAYLLWALMLRLDGFLLGYLNGAREVGTYSVAVLMAEMLWYVPSALTLALNPRMSGGSAAEAAALTQRAGRIGLWLVGSGALLLAVVSVPVVDLVYGEAFLPAVVPLMLLLPGVTAIALAKPISLFYTQHKGSPRVNAWISGVAVAVNLGLNLWWIPLYGPIGAALASSVAYMLVAALLLARFRTEPGFTWSALLKLRREDVDRIRQALAGR
jgi:O-antigen/teichoic acid export membrane protein